MPSILGYSQWSQNYWDNVSMKQWDCVCQGSTKEWTLTTFDLVFDLWETPQDLVHPHWTSDKT